MFVFEDAGHAAGDRLTPPGEGPMSRRNCRIRQNRDCGSVRCGANRGGTRGGRDPHSGTRADGIRLALFRPHTGDLRGMHVGRTHHGGGCTGIRRLARFRAHHPPSWPRQGADEKEICTTGVTFFCGMRLCPCTDLRNRGIDWSGYQRQPHKLYNVGSNPTPTTNHCSDVAQ